MLTKYMKKIIDMTVGSMSGNSVMATRPLFQMGDGGSIPTFPHQFRVMKLEKMTAVNYIKEHHYSHTCSPNPYPAYGMVYQDKLWGVLMFAVPSSENVRASIFGKGTEDSVTELHRLHLLDEAPKNSESWFIGKCLKFLKKECPEIKAVISFADPMEGHKGTIYKATNFVESGKSGAATFYRDTNGILRHPRQKTHKDGKRVSYNITKEDAERRGWTPEKRLGKYRFIYKYLTSKR